MPVEFPGAAATGTRPVLEVRRVVIDDPLVEPLLRELTEEYVGRYGPEARQEMTRYPRDAFAEPAGLLLLLLEDGEPVAGGAYKRYDEHTAELKRMWTHSAHRRRGLARQVLAELERAAGAAGYSRVFLTTGPRQPEARGLYLATGYTPLFDLAADPLTIGPLPFQKYLTS
ncbi:GNAT family N-acetyltransferase [Kitasatospora sp. NPDC052868]|uniref:GNAT family N-acetyltransferase n=1 Tax=Kitasatospora sp. NPDC052868 TaxID=3364060 RepID=UPI0037CCB313